MSIRSKTIPLLATAALVVTACGSDDGGGGGGDDQVSAGDFASSICTAFGDWQESIQGRQSGLEAGLGQDATPEEGKEALQTFLSEVNEDTDQLVEDVNAAGTPDAEQGEEIRDALVEAAEGAQTELQQAEDAVGELPTDSEQAFKTSADELGNNIREALGNVGSGIQEIDSEQLDKAFEEEPACDR